MKQSIWIINNYLLWLFAITLITLNLLKQVPPVLKLKTYPTVEDIEKKKLEMPVHIDKIVKNDIFNTYTKTPPTHASKKSLVSPIPQPRRAQIKPPPEPKKQSIIAPLQATLKGIVLSSDESKSVVIIEDETKKEKLYHLGEKIKDAQLIKISRNKITLLRANGQQETHLLRKEDLDFGPSKEKIEEKWKYVVNKIDDQNFEIDPIKLAQKVPDLSYFIEELSLGTASKQDKTLGIKIGEAKPNEVGAILGLQKNDIIKTINNKSLAQIKNRVKIYKDICRMEKGDTIKLTLNRNNVDTTITYKLTSLEKPKFPISLAPQPTTPPSQSQLNISKSQQRMKKLRYFGKQHDVKEKHQQTIAEMRKRWLEKIKKRSPNTRFR